MNDYTQVTFTVTPVEEVATDILAAMLAEVGYESFVPDEVGMTAYVPHGAYSAEALAQVVAEFPLEGYTIEYTTEPQKCSRPRCAATTISSNSFIHWSFDHS